MATRAAVARARAPRAVVTPSPKKRRTETTETTRSAATAARIIPRALVASPLDIEDKVRRLVYDHIFDGDHGPTPTKKATAPVKTETLGGWCLIDGLVSVANAHNQELWPLIEEHGPPPFYISHLKRINGCDDSNGTVDENPVATTEGQGSSESDSFWSFAALCRIVAGQQLAGSAARTIWRRLLAVVAASEKDTTNLNPNKILELTNGGDDGQAMELNLRAPAGLSNAKTRSIIDLSKHFRDGNLSDKLLLGRNPDGDDIRTRLLQVKGIGPWSVDMFFLFQCHWPNILPTGDLAFRNGTSNFFKVKGKAKGGGLCQKKDAAVLSKLHEPFAPYRSISAFYMYKCSGMSN